MSYLLVGSIFRQRHMLPAAPYRGRHGFSLVEILVAIAVLTMMCAMVVSVISSAQRVVQQTTSRVDQFREARRAFERINQRLSQATLNTYWDYVDSNGNSRTAATAGTFAPYRYARISELRYLQTGTNAASVPFNAPNTDLGSVMIGQAVFFQAPIGSSTTSTLSSMNSLLNTVGYFIEKGPDTNLRPATVNATKIRYRLFELTEPTENLTIYNLTSGSSTYNGNAWFTTPLATNAYSHRLADNIVALLFQAQYNDASGSLIQAYRYSSAPSGSATQAITENNLPPNVRVTMIAVDEPSARRIAEQNILLTDAQDYPSLGALEKDLLNKKLNYRKFESTLPIGSAKWSAQ